MYDTLVLIILGHALHENSLQRQIGFRRLGMQSGWYPDNASVIDRSSTARQPVVKRPSCSLIRFTCDFISLYVRRDVQYRYFLC